jgi:hypothetical protein
MYRSYINEKGLEKDRVYTEQELHEIFYQQYFQGTNLIENLPEAIEYAKKYIPTLVAIGAIEYIPDSIPKKNTKTDNETDTNG